MDTKKLNFFFLRLPLAISLLGHGLVRLPKLQAFSEWMVGSMEKSVLPAALVTPFSYALPIIEAAIGLLLLIGFQLRYTFYAGLALMSILILGSSSIENWGAIEAQLIHAVYFAVLLWWHEK
ncbi:MauE/DoxX family redox-associated membrane protein [Olivibacter sitiensis]|uniref:MauE/DoxX family redox-associated membrane protein n=1 Tax=Olivibacter sitiensis TaxID=376470 RepID=UPI0005652BA0|nr:MauE/DoxX family redox-associated membrane protein [Olivibacter sitiensis]